MSGVGVKMLISLFLLVEPVLASTQQCAGLGCSHLDKPGVSRITRSLRSRVQHDGNIEGAASFVQLGISEGELDQEGEEVFLALERRFKDVSSSLSMASCAKRAKEDIAMTAIAAMEEQMQTSFFFDIIKAVAVPLVMLFVAPLVMKLIMMIAKPVGDFLSPRIVKSCQQYILFFILPVLEGTLGVYLYGKLSKTLTAKLGILLVDAFVFHIPRVLGRELPPQMTNYVLRVESPVLAKEVAHRALHTLTHSLTHSLSRGLPRLVAGGVQKQLTHNLVNYYYCIYCYEKGEFCNYCHAYLGLKAKSESAEDFGIF